MERDELRDEDAYPSPEEHLHPDAEAFANELKPYIEQFRELNLLQLLQLLQLVLQREKG